MGIFWVASDLPRIPYRARHRRPRRADRWVVGCYVAAAVLAAGASALGAMALALVVAPPGGTL